jgi:hypothetical protein
MDESHTPPPKLALPRPSKKRAAPLIATPVSESAALGPIQASSPSPARGLSLTLLGPRYLFLLVAGPPVDVPSLRLPLSDPRCTLRAPERPTLNPLDDELQ